MAVLVWAPQVFGGRLAQVLVARGETVRILARPGSDTRHLAGLPIEIVQGDLAATASLAAAVKGVTHIYHCAACSTDWAPWDVFYAANVAGVRNLLDAAQRVSTLQRFLHVSTTDVYGYPAVPCDESHPLTDVGLPYNRTKCQGEECVWEASRRGLPVTVVRPATIYGPRSKDFVIEIAKLIRQGTMAVVDGGAPRWLCYVGNAGRHHPGSQRAEALAALQHRGRNRRDLAPLHRRLADGLGQRRLDQHPQPSHSPRPYRVAHRLLRLRAGPCLPATVYLLPQPEYH
jgi:nucleoside-diphosphate-sugar epimerase